MPALWSTGQEKPCLKVTPRRQGLAESGFDSGLCHAQLLAALPCLA
jgi:hypothetical protein